MPYIHMTTSASLPVLREMGYTFRTIQALLLEHEIAPLSGEINNGGLESVFGNPSYTAFADCEDTSHWTFERLMSSYGEAVSDDESDEDQGIDEYYEEQINWDTLIGYTAFIVMALRYKQLGLQPRFTPDELSQFKDQFQKKRDKTVSDLKFNLVVAKYVVVEKGGNYFEALFYLANELRAQLTSDFYNLSDEAQFSALKAMDLPAYITIKRYDAGPTQSAMPPLMLGDNPFRVGLKLIFRFPDTIEFLSKYLEAQSEGSAKVAQFQAYMGAFERRIKGDVEILDRKIALLLKILDPDQPCRDFRGDENVEDPFPIAFVLEDAKSLRPCDDEYRATDPLKIGEDITILLTDAAHMERLAAFLEEAGLADTVRLFTFEEYQGVRESHNWASFFRPVGGSSAGGLATSVEPDGGSGAPFPPV